MIFRTLVPSYVSISMNFIKIEPFLYLIIVVNNNLLCVDTFLRDPVCISHECLSIANLLIQNMNTQVNPCDNFYEYACGKFLQSAKIPRDERSINPLAEDQKELIRNVHYLFNQLNETTERYSFVILKRLYKACMANMALESGMNHEGIDYMLNSFNAIGGWPVLSPHLWKDMSFNWQNFTYTLSKNGFNVDYLMKISIEINPKNTTEYIIVIDPPTLGMPRNLFLNEQSDMFQFYYEYMVNVAVNLGAERDIAMEDLKEVIYLERDLALLITPKYEFDDIYTMNIDSLANIYPDIISIEYINRIFNNDETITKENSVTINRLQYLSDLEYLIRGTPDRVLANYICWKVVFQFAQFLNHEIRTFQQTFMSALTGETDSLQDWEECINIAKDFLPESFQTFYTTRTLMPEVMDNVVNIFKSIRAQFEAHVMQIDWLDTKSKFKILIKVRAMKFIIGCPETNTKKQEIYEFYKDLHIFEDDLILAIVQINKFYKEKLFQRYISRMNPKKLYNHKFCTFKNAFYIKQLNKIEIPPYVLHGVYYHLNRPHYVNYGILGAAIGHEMGHGFDMTGLFYDENGTISHTCLAQLQREISKRSLCIIGKHNDFKITGTDLLTNGYRTQDEDIADNTGIRMAYLAFQHLLEHGNATMAYLPGLNNTLNQLFWISYVNIRCFKYRQATLEHIVKTGVHSIGEFRVNGVLSSIEEFSRDFQCPLGANMNPPKKCRVY